MPEEVPRALVDTAEFNPESTPRVSSACLNNDIGKWPEVLTSSDIDSCVKMDTGLLQNCDEDLFARKSVKQSDMGKGCEKGFVRKCHKNFFIRKTRNGETIKRSWLCFSPSDGSVYCYVCKLFSPIRSQFTHGGYSNWKNAAARLIEHETSKLHLNSVIDYAQRTKRCRQIDQELTHQAEIFAKYWREVLKRLISVIVFISERGLAFRGENEILGSPQNGNYMGILELLAEYDDFLRGHLETHGNRGSGHTNYLSSTICEEIINTIGKHVFDEIISRIKKCKYFSISLDSTPDEGHVDQLSLVFRYMEDCTPVERFLTFMPNQGHKAKEMFNGLCTFLKENDLDIKNCRGQSYDNASAMSGKYNGLQALVLEENRLAAWIPCAGHSLNLVLQAAAGCCLNAVSFFDFLEEIFVYFTASTNRYQTLTESLKRAETEKNILVPKRTTTTRWSCRADATKALLRGYQEIKQTLVKMSEDMEDSGKSRLAALGLVRKMNNLETGLYAVFWDDILGQVNKTSESLQNPRIDVNSAASLLKSLRSLIQGKRECFKEYEQKAIKLTNCLEYEGESKRKRKTNVRLAPLDCVQAPEVDLTPSDTFRTQSFITVIDELEGALTKRLQAYELINTRFGFLNKLDMLSNDEVLTASKTLVDSYSEDLDEELGNEVLQFKNFSNQFQNEYEKSEKHISKERWMYQLMLENNVKDCFPNVEVALRMYLSLMVTNCSAERSFSKLKLIKNRHPDLYVRRQAKLFGLA